MMPRKKSKYRIIPTNTEKLGSCWALKEGEVLLGTFITKLHAEKRKVQLEQKNLEDFVLIKTINQELKLEE
jgi:hypothetical protein